MQNPNVHHSFTNLLASNLFFAAFIWLSSGIESLGGNLAPDKRNSRRAPRRRKCHLPGTSRGSFGSSGRLGCWANKAPLCWFGLVARILWFGLVGWVRLGFEPALKTTGKINSAYDK